MSHTVFEQFDRKCIESIEGSQFPDLLMDHFCHEIGPRPTGSPAMREASQYACEQLRELGAGTVHAEQVELFSWEDAPVCFEVTSPRKQRFDAIEYVYSVAGKVEGVLLDGGSGSEEEQAKLSSQIKPRFPI